MILITGANGFIGKALAARLGKLAYPTVRSAIPGMHALDVTEEAQYADIPKEVTGVFHTVAKIPYKPDMSGREKEFERVNVDGTRLVAKFCRERDIKLVYSSTCSVYGTPSALPLPVTEEPLLDERELNLYAKTKLQGERICETMPGLKYATLRYSSVYGLGMSTNSVLPMFIDRAKKGQALPVYGTGTRTQDFVCISDVAEANMQALALPSAEGTYNVGSGEPVSMLGLASEIINVFGADGCKIEMRFDGRPEGPDFSMDIGKAMRELHYRPHSLSWGLNEYRKALK